MDLGKGVLELAWRTTASEEGKCQGWMGGRENGELCSRQRRQCVLRR